MASHSFKKWNVINSVSNHSISTDLRHRMLDFRQQPIDIFVKDRPISTEIARSLTGIEQRLLGSISTEIARSSTGLESMRKTLTAHLDTWHTWWNSSMASGSGGDGAGTSSSSSTWEQQQQASLQASTTTAQRLRYVVADVR